MFLITLDTDWAPDFVIRSVAEQLIEKRVKATWFVTHDSEAIRWLQKFGDLFELGLHPNIAPNSTQGNSVHSVMSSLRHLLPTSRIMRSHGLCQSTEFLKTVANEFSIEIDVSLFLPGASNLAPHNLPLKDGGGGLVRVPYFWEDDIECYQATPAWNINDPRYHVPGLKVFDFHPIHIYLNSNSMKAYDILKKERSLISNTPANLSARVNHDTPGTGSLFSDLVDYIAAKQGESYSILDIALQTEAVT